MKQPTALKARRQGARPDDRQEHGAVLPEAGDGVTRGTTPEVPLSRLPYVDGVLSAQQVADTAAAIAAMQEPWGAVPWTSGEHVDIWNHVEAAMAMLVGGQVEAAERAYAWIPTMQRADGSWPMKIVGGLADDERGEVNMSAYFAVGLWHHWLVRRDIRFIERYWPSVRAGLDFVVSLQDPFGGIRWTPVDDFCLLTGRLLDLPLAARRGGARGPDGRPAAGVGAWPAAGSGTPCARTPTSSPTSRPTRWTGTTPSSAGRSGARPRASLLAKRWSEFVVPGLGIHCVSTNPWVTGAETCEPGHGPRRHRRHPPCAHPAR
ncbi:hypothetical protein [Nocardioides convexus]|uniref:hypothetical protein n=1 Tax=Nocardioides convexus TaxID=2712224 RepID=UPI0024186569|nr:hypothetical protein [Nocardioides convexus]